jgi:hypothetical protein
MLECAPVVRLALTQKVRLRKSSISAFAVLALEQPRHLAAARQRDQRKGVVVDGVGVDEAAAVALPHFLIAPTHGDAGGDDGADAGAADEIDRHPASRSARMMPR